MRTMTLAPFAVAILLFSTNPSLGQEAPEPPRAGRHYFVPGVGATDDRVGDAIIRWYLSDPEFDQPRADPAPVDTRLGDESPAMAARSSTLTFATAELASGWVFQNANGTWSEMTTPGTVGGLQITHAAPLAGTHLFSYVGIWTDYDLLNPFANGGIVALRAGISSDVVNNPADASRPRLRITPDPEPFSPQVPSTQGIDFAFIINENDENSPVIPALSAPGKTYVAYAAMPAHGSAGRHGVAWDHDATGASGGVARTVALHALEVGTADAAAFTGSASPIASGTYAAGGFRVGEPDGWAYFNLRGLGNFGGYTLWSGGEPLEGSDRIGHVDADSPIGLPGGLAFFNTGDPMTFGDQAAADRIEYAAGALLLNSFDVATDSAAGGNPAVRLEARPLNPSIQQTYTLRSRGDHWIATNPGTATYDLVWAGPDNGQVDSSGDDLVIGFDLFNLNSDPLHGGETQLDATRYSEIAPTDPNNP